MTHDFTAWRRSIDASIEATLALSVAATAPAGPGVREITDPLLATAAGGKRVRALLLLASHLAYGGSDDEAALAVATSLELFQTAALVHDDVLDRSESRRGRPAAHRVIAHVHARGAWHGDAAAFGEAGAILAGDLALMACQRALGSAVARLDSTRAAAVQGLFCDMADLVTAGQYADMRAAAQPLDAFAGQAEEIAAVMRSKTASYTGEFPLALGAAIAGAPGASVEESRRAGRDLGIAFQLRDDLLGLMGSPDVTGKPAGDDVREGKRTAVLWRAWTQADRGGREAIGSVLGNRDATEAQVAEVIRAVRATDAESWCEAQIAQHADRARETLAAAGMSGDGLSRVLDLVARAVSRTS
ncbi:polyprenyl synthetase family protein [Demequina sp. NBRC 110053]|uniref:polyprenyl synthetase family protein n=1 Tax=Demequina sp. NBRC 110053 TaxID=1570342 RepID=UPI0013565B15|nr:polyprenyl synthetase family protein [Demequina sp. NBRC 110053]